MRIIKLSPDDPEFTKPPMVDTYFRETLPNRKPPGLFFLTSRAIGADGIAPGEKLIFTYKGDLVYRARAASTRQPNVGQDNRKYPFYFLVDVPSITAIRGTLRELQQELEMGGLKIPNLVRSRSWPMFADNGREAALIEAFVAPDQDTDPLEQIVLATLVKDQRKGQGFVLNKKLRDALERYAMDAAKEYLKSERFVWEDHSKNHPYDLYCSRGKEERYIEVKGTQTKGEEIILTNGEVEFARSHKEQMGLFILHSIKVSEAEGDFHLAGGTRKVLLPWDVDEGCLTPISLMYRI